MKRIPKWVIGSALAASAVLVVLLFFFWDRSVYSATYVEARFQALQMGMQRAEVERLLGPPLQEQREAASEAWWYGERGRSPEQLFASDPQVVKFGQDGLVAERRGPLLEKVQVGMSAADVLKVAGTPDRQTPRSAVTAHYSMPGSWGLYKARIITYDERDKVVKITKFSIWD